MYDIPLEAVTPGVRLAKPAYAKDGKILVPSGELLSPTAIAYLKKYGVTHVTVTNPALIQAGASFAYEDIPEDMLESIKEGVDLRFSHVDLDSPFYAALYKLALEKETRLQVSKGGKGTADSRLIPAFTTPKPGKACADSLITASLAMGTLPAVFHKLVEIINDPYSSTSDAAEVISADTALSAKLLRLVNSAFYGLPSRIDSVPRAVALIGVGQIVMLAMGATLVTAFQGVPVTLVNMQSFWTHSLACGLSARLLAQRCGAGQNESYFIAGLLHDIARLIIYSQLPKHSLYLLTEARRQKTFVHALEEDTLGFTHEELGGELLKGWLCPEELILRVQTHHAHVDETSTPEECILPVANLIVQALNYGTSGESVVSPVDTVAWGHLGVTADAIPGLVMQIDERLTSLRSLFLSSD